jgi:ribonuclease P/MRP protein subunit POP5
VTSLPKARRPRRRYLGVGVETPGDPPDRRAVQAAVWDATTALFGDPGSAAVDPTVVRAAGSFVVVRVRRGEVERARAALACVTDVDGDAAALRVRGVSGTIRACVERYRDGPERGEGKGI